MSVPKGDWFIALAQKILKEKKRPLSPKEIWQIAGSMNYREGLDGDDKRLLRTLYSVIYTDAEHPRGIFYEAGGHPKRFFLKELRDTVPQSSIEEGVQRPEDAIPEGNHYLERDLHAFLAHFAQAHFHAYTKTIKHNTSKKGEFGEWVHPDMIGIYFEEWCPEVLDFAAATGTRGVKLYSFELKKGLDFTNLREAFFQAVSNSSWANEGYLVAADVHADPDFRSELSRLSTSFGIGIIGLDIKAPEGSEVLFPARERGHVDWDTVEKLTMNADVKRLLVRFKNDLNNKEITKEQYDKIFSVEELVNSIKKTPVMPPKMG